MIRTPAPTATVIAVANQKGGVAKTTTVASLGAAWSDIGQRVLIVDLDPQACLTFSVGYDPESIGCSVHQVLLGEVAAYRAVIETEEGSDLLPATIELALAEQSLAARGGRERLLELALEPLLSSYDFILIDCPPTLGLLTTVALTASDGVLIPLQCETLSHRGVGQLLDTIYDVRKFTNRRLSVIGVLPTLFDSRTTHGRTVLERIGDDYGVTVLSPAIPKSIRFAEAPAVGRTVLSTAGSTKGAAAYRDLAEQLLSWRGTS
jgi:chromosome partitioning protein